MGNLPFEFLQWTLALAGVWLISGTLMNFSSHPHEDIRAALYEAFGDDLFSDFAKVSFAVEKYLTDWGNDDEADDEEAASGNKGLPEKKRKKLLDPGTWERDGRLVEVATRLRQTLGDTLFEDHNLFRDRAGSALKDAGSRLPAARANLPGGQYRTCRPLLADR